MENAFGGKGEKDRPPPARQSTAASGTSGTHRVQLRTNTIVYGPYSPATYSKVPVAVALLSCTSSGS
jgi:hypothetical protein